MPDEDTFTVPGSWRRMRHPRRGGEPGPALKADRAAGWRLAAEVRDRIDDLLATTDEPEPFAPALAYLDSGGATATPDAAAVLARMVTRYVTEGTAWKRAGELAGFVDTWVADHGIVFAVAAVRAYQRVVIGWRGSPMRPSYYVTALDPTPPDHREADPLVRRLRAHLAVATDADHDAAVAELATRRDDVDDRLLAAYLVPGRADWVTDACAATGALPPILLWTLASADVVNERAAKVDGWTVTHDTSTLPTLVEGAGVGVAPALAVWLDSAHTSADGLKRLAAMLAMLPTDEAFDLLLTRLGRKYVRAAVVEAATRFPVRAARLLARSTDPAAAELLRTHVLGNHDILAAADLPADVRAAVDGITGSAEGIEEAAPDALPALLVEPPWTRGNKATAPVVVEGLRSGDDVEVVWAPGERENWLAGRGWEPEDVASTPWAEYAEAYLAHRLPPYKEAALFGCGPAEVVRPLLADWQPAGSWHLEGWLAPIAARYERDALPAVIHLAKAGPATHVGLLVPFAGAELAGLMVDWLGLRSVRRSVLAWLHRHPRAAAHHLVPPALARPGGARRGAEAALRLLPPDEVASAAKAHGGPAEAAIGVLLATDPLDLVPARPPKVPEWADPGPLPRLVLRDGGRALPASAARHVLTMLVMSRPGEVYAGVDVVRQLCTPASLADFAWGLFQAWQGAGAPAKESWVLETLGRFGDDGTVRRLSPLIRAWPGKGGHTRAVNALEVLESIGTEVALRHLYGIAQTVTFKGLRTRAREKIEAVAAELELSADQLGDRLVPDLGLDSAGGLTLDYGPRRFTVGFDERLRPYVETEDGTRREDLPKPGEHDDPALAPDAYAWFTAFRKDARTAVAEQVRRLERAMVSGRRWPADEFVGLFVEHPLLWHVVRRLVWTVEGETTAFRVLDDRTFADLAGETLTLPEAAVVGIAHPVTLAAAVPAWATLFADEQITQPFPQLDRPVHQLTAAEAGSTHLSRFEGRTVPSRAVLGLTRRGWQRAAPEDAGVEPWLMRPVPNGHAVVVNLEPGLAVGAVDAVEEQTVQHVWLSGTGRGAWAPSPGPGFGALDPVTASEVLDDLTGLTA
ncbi:DUF4132 domain-containing protein [Actinophytocola oryzae]|uniref:Uncharacterized protein DUF4132 n=1 Tax=Actinophytocola oryzae TaxID=502181 RepID=A0A4R7V2I1_9PSEU|nr:DUF4132 domain-containing protein [Actinophytocola oryzae]TDV43558.1 uncharacterized protein DUF4132 [Actinophytocola oryzae]